MRRLRWWSRDESPDTMADQIRSVLQETSGPYLEIFRKRSILNAVIVSNHVEGTIDPGFGTSHAIFDDIPSTQLIERSWNAEGSTDVETTRRQLTHHYHAMEFALEQATADILPQPSTICEIHRLLMENAVDENEVAVRHGQYRTRPSHNGAGYVYLEPSLVPAAMQQLCDQFQASVHSLRTHPEMDIFETCKVVAWLMFKFLQIHPYENGNGRTARILSTYAFVLLGAPFAIPLSNGHRKNRKHFLQCVVNEQKGLSGHMASYLLECYAMTCANFGSMKHMAESALEKVGDGIP